MGERIPKFLRKEMEFDGDEEGGLHDRTKRRLGVHSAFIHTSIAVVIEDRGREEPAALRFLV